MTLRKRRVIYYAFAAVFFMAGAYLIASAHGIVVDWDTMRIVKTGGIYLAFSPANATVFINGEATDKTTGILNRGVILDKLLPKTYHISVRKEGYGSWEKDLRVEEGLFTSAHSIRLWPEIPGREFIATSTTNDIIPIKSGFIERTEGEKLIFLGEEIRGTDVFASREGSDGIITESENGALFFLNAKNPKTAINIRELFDSLRLRQLGSPEDTPLRHAIIHPFSEEKIIVASDESIYTIDFKKIELEKIADATSSLSMLVETGNEVLGISSSGKITGANLFLKKPVSFDCGAVGPIQKFEAAGSKFFFTNENNQLFVFERESGSAKKIAENVQSFAPSPDGGKVAWIDSEKKVFVYYAEKDQGDLTFEKGTVSLLGIKPIEINKKTKLFWLPSFPSFIFLESSGKIMVSEIDPRGGTTNTATITEPLSDVLFTKEEIYVIEKEGDIFIISRIQF